MDQSSAANDLPRRRRVDITPIEQARLLDLSNDAIIVRDVDNRIIYWNHGATEIYGWTRVEAIGQDLHTPLRTEFELPLEQLITRLHQHDQMEGEVVQVTRDGAAARYGAVGRSIGTRMDALARSSPPTTTSARANSSKPNAIGCSRRSRRHASRQKRC